MDVATHLAPLFDEHGVRAELAPGAVVVRSGEQGSSLVRVVAGRLAITVTHDGREVLVGEVGPAELLGAVSVLLGSAPTATVTALDDVVVDVVDGDVARDHLAGAPDLRRALQDQVRATLGRDTLLHALLDLLDADDAELAATAGRLRVRWLAAGEALCEQGAVERTGFLVLGGRCGIVRDDVEVARIGRGTMVGEVALLTGAPRTATVVALRETVVAELDETDLRHIAAEQPTVASALFARVADAATATGRGADRTTRPAATVAVASVTPRANLRATMARFADTLTAFGAVRQLTAAVVDRDLGASGASVDPVDDPGAARLTAYLHEQEFRHDHVLLEVPPTIDEWGRRALTASDHVAVAVSSDPSDEERDAVRAIVAAAPRTAAVTVLLHHPAGSDLPSGTAALRDDLGVADVLHVRDGVPGDLARAARLVAGRGTALVLGGGGAPGFAHLGVRRAMEAEGVPVDLVVGSSIGSTMAAAIAADVPRERVAQRVQELFSGVLDYTVPVTSLIKGERIALACEAFFEGRDIEDLWVPFRCVSTNLTHSRSEVHAHGPAATAVRASLAIPGVIPPVPAGEDLLVDGGVLDNLPVGVAATDPRCGTIVAVDVAPPTGPKARGDYGLSVSGFRALAATVRRGRSEFPGLTTILLRSTIVGSLAQRAQSLADAEVDLLLELHVRGVGLLDFDTDVEKVIEQGDELAHEAVAAWAAARHGDTEET